MKIFEPPDAMIDGAATLGKAAPPPFAVHSEIALLLVNARATAALHATRMAAAAQARQHTMEAGARARNSFD